ncbi:MAG: hypothetical protein HONBIEJF_00593 [Fimbriimonadaceae bacterium]|nr:hypothetical protein [Fimbriimonadaceae bacterium]
MPVSVFRTSTLIDAPLEVVFDFFSRAENLERITPRSLRFEILTSLPIEMQAGAIIEYRIRLFGVPFKWLTEITAWEPGRRFVDVQRKGPYRVWEHEHRFEAEKGMTRMFDTVRFEPRGWVLSPLINALFVRGQVRRIFEHRTEAIRRELEHGSKAPA